MLQSAGVNHPIKGIYTWIDARGNTVLAVQTTAQNFSFILDDTINDGNIIKAAAVLLDPSQAADHFPDFREALPPQPAKAPPAKTHLKKKLIAGAAVLGAGILGRAQLGILFSKAAQATGAAKILEKTLKQAAGATTKMSDLFTSSKKMCEFALQTAVSSAPIFLYGTLASASLSALAQKKITGKVSPKTTLVHGITGGLGAAFYQNTISAAITALQAKGSAALLSGQALTELALTTALSATPALLLGGIAAAALVAIAQKKAGSNINAKATLMSGVVGGISTAFYRDTLLATLADLQTKGAAALLSGQALTGLALTTALSATPALLCGGIALAAITQRISKKPILSKTTLGFGVTGGIGAAVIQEKILSTAALLFTSIKDTGMGAVQSVQIATGVIGTAGVVGLAAAGIIALIGSGAAGTTAKNAMHLTAGLLKRGGIAAGQIALSILTKTARKINLIAPQTKRNNHHRRRRNRP